MYIRNMSASQELWMLYYCDLVGAHTVKVCTVCIILKHCLLICPGCSQKGLSGFVVGCRTFRNGMRRPVMYMTVINMTDKSRLISDNSDSIKVYILFAIEFPDSY